MMMLPVLLLAAALAAVPAAAVAQPQNPSAVFNDVGFDQRLDAQIPLDLAFRNEEGTTVRLADYFGDKPVVLSLVYYKCPMLCTQVLNGMTETFNILKLAPQKDFEVVTVSIDPAETPDLAAAKKKQYLGELHRAGGEEGWHFLTGDQDAITKLAAAAGFRYVYDPASKQFAHASGIMVVTPQGRIARYLFGVEYGARDLTFSLIEAAKGRIGSPAERLQLLCYAYDPSSGTYSLAVINIMKAGGIVTLIVLGSFIGISLRRERKRARTIGPKNDPKDGGKSDGKSDRKSDPRSDPKSELRTA